MASARIACSSGLPPEQDSTRASSSSAIRAVARYTSTGTPDPNFDFDGKAVVDGGSNGDQGLGVAVQGDGRVVVSGATGATTDDSWPSGSPPGSARHDVQLRWQADGRLRGGNDEAEAVAVLSNGKVVLAGAASTATGHDFGVVRLKQNGALDLTFSATM